MPKEKVTSGPVLVVQFVEDPATEVESRGNDWLARLRLTMLVVIICIGSMAAGFGAYASPAIPDINGHRSPFRLNEEEQSWFASLGNLAAIVGSLYMGVVIDQFGRKLSIIQSSIPFVCGCVLIAGASNVYFLYAGRLLTGFAVPQMLISINTYMAEIAPPHVRGLLVSFHEVFSNVGTLCIYVLGSYIHYDWLAISCAIPPVIFTCLMLLMPESPRWLLTKGRTQEAANVQWWLKGGRESTVVILSRQRPESKEPIAEKKQMSWLDYFRPPLLRCFVVSQVLNAAQQLSGFQVVRTYTVTIFQSTGVHLDAYTETIIVGAMTVAGTVLCVIIIDLMSRRLLFVTSTIAMAASMTSMGVFFFFLEKEKTDAGSTLSWLPLLSFVIFTFSYALGCGSLPALVTNEMFPTHARGRATGMGVATDGLCAFLITKLFHNITLGVGSSGAFWICGCFCLLGSAFAFIYVPETKGKMLEELNMQRK